MSKTLPTEPRGRRGTIALATVLIVLGVVLAAGLMLLLLAFLGGEEGAGSPEGTVGGGALAVVHRDASTSTDA